MRVASRVTYGGIVEHPTVDKGKFLQTHPSQTPTKNTNSSHQIPCIPMRPLHTLRAQKNPLLLCGFVCPFEPQRSLLKPFIGAKRRPEKRRMWMIFNGHKSLLITFIHKFIHKLQRLSAALARIFGNSGRTLL